MPEREGRGARGPAPKAKAPGKSPIAGLTTVVKKVAKAELANVRDEKALGSKDAPTRQRARGRVLDRMQATDNVPAKLPKKLRGPVRSVEHKPTAKADPVTGKRRYVKTEGKSPDAEAYLGHRARQAQARARREEERRKRGTVGPDDKSGLHGAHAGTAAKTIDDHIRAGVRKQVAVQRKDDATERRTIGVEDPSTGPLARKGDAQREDRLGAQTRRAGAAVDRKVAAEQDRRLTTKAKPRYPRAAELAKKADDGTDRAITEAAVRAGRDIDHDSAKRLSRVLDDQRKVESVDEDRSKLTAKNVARNAYAEVKDAVSNPLPVVQTLAKAGTEVLGSGVHAARGEGTRKTPTADAVVKSALDDPVVHLAHGRPKEALKSAVRHPLSALGEGMAAAKGAGAAVDVARGAEASRAARARHAVVVPADVVKTKRGVEAVKTTLGRRKAIRERGGTASDAPRALVTKDRRYSDHPVTRVVQKSADVAKAAVGRDPDVARGRKAQRIVKRHAVARLAQEKKLGLDDELAVGSGHTLDDWSGSSERTWTGSPQSKVMSKEHRRTEREAQHDRRLAIVSQELYAHIGHPDDIGRRIAALDGALARGEVGAQARHARRTHLQSQGIDDAKTLTREGDKAAAKAEANARETAQALRDYQEAVARSPQEAGRFLNRAGHKTELHYDGAKMDELRAAQRAGDTERERQLERELADSAEARPRSADPKDDWAHRAAREAEARRVLDMAITAERGRHMDLDPVQAARRTAIAKAVALGDISHGEHGWVSHVEGLTPEDLIAAHHADQGFLRYDHEPGGGARQLGQRGPGEDFTGATVHGTDYGSRTLGDQHAARMREVTEARVARGFTGRAFTTRDGAMSQAGATKRAAAMSKASKVRYVAVPVSAKFDHASARALAGRAELAGPGEQGYVVMAKADAKLWDDQMKREGRALAAGQMLTRNFVRAVLPLNPAWMVGNQADLATRLALTGWRRGDHKGAAELRAAVEREHGPQVARELFDTVLGHVGSRSTVARRDARDVLNSGRLPDGSVKPGRLTDLGEKVHGAAKPLTQGRAKRVLDRAIDWGFDKSSRVENELIQAAQGTVARRLAHELGVARENHAELAKRLAEPGMAERFHELTLATVGDYLRYGPDDRKWRHVAVPFLQWIKAATKFALVTLPADHPVKVALYLEAARATEEQRRLLGMSDWISDAEAKQMGLPAPADGFLNGGMTVGEHIYPVGHLTSFGQVGAELSDPLGTFGNALLPHMNRIVAAVLGHKGAETTYQARRAAHEAGFGGLNGETDRGGLADLSIGRAGDTLRQVVKAHVPLGSRGLATAGLNDAPDAGGSAALIGGPTGSDRRVDPVARMIGVAPQGRPLRKTKTPVRVKGITEIGNGLVEDVPTGRREPGQVPLESVVRAERTDPKARAREEVGRAVDAIGQPTQSVADAMARSRAGTSKTVVRRRRKG